MWAGLTALINQKLGQRVGFLNPLAYGLLANSGSFQDMPSGNNGAYKARAGWDACTGWGRPTVRSCCMRSGVDLRESSSLGVFVQLLEDPKGLQDL